MACYDATQLLEGVGKFNSLGASEWENVTNDSVYSLYAFSLLLRLLIATFGSQNTSQDWGSVDTEA